MRILFITMFLLILTACQSQPATDPVHVQLHQHADRIEQLAAQQSLDWGDFLAEPLSFIVYEPEGAALLVTSAEPAQGYTQQTTNRYLYPDGLPRLSSAFILNYPIGTLSVTAVSLRDSPQQTAKTFFHEHFHSYQDTRFTAVATHRALSSEHFTNPQIRALLEMRRQLLVQALRSEQPASDFLHDLQALDHLLAMQFDDTALTHLYQLEIIEGTAEYAETSITQPSSAARSEQLQAQLGIPEHGVHSASDLRWYSYGSGAAITSLLHQLDATVPKTISAHLTLPDVIAAHPDINSPASFTDEALSTVLSRYNIERWLVWAMNESPAQVFSLQQFEQLTPAAITFKLILTSAEAASHLDMNFAGGPAGMEQPDDGGFLLSQPEAVSVYGRATSLVIRDTPTYLMTPDQPPAIEVTVRVDTLPDLCDGMSDCTLETLKLDWQGIQFEHSADTRVEQQGEQLTITIYEH